MSIMETFEDVGSIGSTALEGLELSCYLCSSYWIVLLVVRGPIIPSLMMDPLLAEGRRDDGI